MTFRRSLIALAMVPLAALAATPALADGKVRCNGGPKEHWQPLVELRKQAWKLGWTVQKAHAEGDCYEVYARTEEGQAVEAFFHPVTLEKLVVFRRGREVFRKPGFGG